MPPVRHVLIVDDHAALRAVLAHVVAQINPNATLAETANGAEALAAIAQHLTDLIITDYQMPIMGGLELVRALRSHGKTMPILVLSSDTSIAEAILATGATAFLPKPFRVRALKELLYALLADEATQSGDA